METHLVLCCNSKCKDYEEREVFITHKDNALLTSNGIRINNDKRYIFITNINSFPEKIRGIRINSCRACEHTHLNEEVEGYLKLITVK
jgi:hypothetical protein